MPIDPTAPIVPGVGAAGFLLGADVLRTVAECGVFAEPEEIVSPWVPGPNHVRYHSAIVDLWAYEGRITQIGIHGSYEGQLLGRIGIGSTLGDAQRLIGRVVEDDEDNLVFADLRGVCLDWDAQPPLGPWDPNNRIEWIFVYSASAAPISIRKGTLDALSV
jgi:hypothetical protein